MMICDMQQSEFAFGLYIVILDNQSKKEKGKWKICCKEQQQQQEILDVNVNKIGDDISAQDEWIWVIFVHQRVNTKNKERRRRKDKTPTNGALHWILIWLFVDAQCVHLRIDKKMWDCHRVDSNVDRWTCIQHCNYGCCCLCNWPFAVQVRGHSPLFQNICLVFYFCFCIFIC